jgi:hypothetical protein
MIDFTAESSLVLPRQWRQADREELADRMKVGQNERNFFLARAAFQPTPDTVRTGARAPHFSFDLYDVSAVRLAS